MARYIAHLACATLMLWVVTDTAPAQQSGTTDTKNADAEGSAEALLPKPSTHVVKKGPFRIEVELEGIFESEQTAEVTLRPETWAQFIVVEAVAHGAHVEEGDVLVSLDRTIDFSS